MSRLSSIFICFLLQSVVCVHQENYALILPSEKSINFQPIFIPDSLRRELNLDQNFIFIFLMILLQEILLQKGATLFSFNFLLQSIVWVHYVYFAIILPAEKTLIFIPFPILIHFGPNLILID